MVICGNFSYYCIVSLAKTSLGFSRFR